jgi:hypothetical protein
MPRQRPVVGASVVGVRSRCRGVEVRRSCRATTPAREAVSVAARRRPGQARPGSPPSVVCSTGEDSEQTGGAARAVAALQSASLIPFASPAAAATSVRPVGGCVSKAADPSPCSFLAFQATSASSSDQSLVRVTRKLYCCDVNPAAALLAASWSPPGWPSTAWAWRVSPARPVCCPTNRSPPRRLSRWRSGRAGNARLSCVRR